MMNLNKFFVLGLFIAFWSCNAPSYTHVETENITLDASYEAQELERLIYPYREAVDLQMNTVIGRADSALLAYKPESPLGNFVADILLDYVLNKRQAHFQNMNEKNTTVLLNFGGLRAPINEGDITIGSIFELMPFDNTLSIVELDSLGCVQLMNYLLESGGQPVANAKFELSAPVKQWKIQNELIDFSRPIYVCTSDYLANGGDKMIFFKEALVKFDTGVLLRSIFIEYIKNIGQIHPVQIDNRMQILN